jgi:hypothetical protein
MDGECSIWSESLKGRDHLEDLGIDEDNIKNISNKYGRIAWAGFIWFRLGTSGRLL